MAFGALQRKSSNPQPFRPATAISRSNALFRKRLKTGGLLAAVMITLWMIMHLFSGSSSSSSAARNSNARNLGPAPPGTPEVVIVTVLDPKMKDEYLRKIKENRDDYARRHGMDLHNYNATVADLNVRI
jgi:mannan polymerase II complex MNN11 subunit